jgi:Uma2 family endonuclease
VAARPEESFYTAMVSAQARPPLPATAADLEARPDRPSAEVVDGVIVEKAAASFEHGDAQMTLGELLNPPYQRGRGGPGGWWFGSEVEVELETHEVYLPDVAGWRKDRVPDRPRGRPIRIRPDWVAEILSKTTAERDLGKKLASYQRVGVQHYWIVDPERETLTVYRWTHEGFVVHQHAGKAETIRAAPFDELELEVALLFGG